MKPLGRLAGLVFICALALGLGCGDREPLARVLQTNSMGEVIGGPGAYGGPGDYLLENDKIRVLIHGRPGATGSSTGFGGTIIDADLQRPQRSYSLGRGNDLLLEFGPMVNLRVPRPLVDAETAQFTIVRAESNADGGALLRVDVPGGNILDVISLIGVVVPPLDTPDIRMRIDYELRPGESFVRVTADAYIDGNSDVDGLTEMRGFEGSESLLDVLLGDEERAFGAWLTLVGGKMGTFVPGSGFDPWLSLNVGMAMGNDVFANPQPFDYVAGVGDRVSYGMYTDAGDLLVPLASSNFTVAVSHAVACTEEEPDCLVGRGLRMRGYFSVGDGDVASAMEPFFELRDRETLSVRGVVMDMGEGSPVSKADVFALRDPWPELSDEEVAAKPYAEVVAANREASRSPDKPMGDAGVLMHFRSDAGDDPRVDGDFEGRMPVPGSDRFLMVAMHEGVLGPVQPVRVTPGEEASVVVPMPQTGTVVFQVQDESGSQVPGRLTIGQCMVECAQDADCGEGRACLELERRCVPQGGCSADSDCDPDERCREGACVCEGAGAEPREFGGHWARDGVIHMHYGAQEPVAFEMTPGTYEVILSRGIEYDIERRFVTVTAGKTTQVLGQLSRVVDTAGWISADFHVHGANSSDAGLPHLERVRSFVGEGVEFLSSSDHDVLTNYGPTIREAGWETLIATQVGLESSPLMLGHILGFPLELDETQPQNMPSEFAFDWYGQTTGESIAAMRAMGDLGGGGDAVVIMPHVYEYFDYYGLDPFNLSLNPDLLFQVADPLFEEQNFSAAFDGMEAANGKSQDFIRRPTAKEARDYNIALAALGEQLASGELDMESYVLRHIDLGRSTVAGILARTPEEQDALVDASFGEDCICLPRESCGAMDAEPLVPCVDFRGIVDDWFRMLNRGVRRSVTANSDTHDLYDLEAGMPRNFIRSSTDLPVQLDHQELSMAVRRGALVASYGPFIELQVAAHELGSTVEVASGEPVPIGIRVQSPTWFDVDRVELYRNGRIIQSWEDCGDGQGEAGEDCIRLPNDTVVNLDVVVEDTPPEDAWYAVAAVGIKGRDLAPVYSSVPLARLGFVESLDSLLTAIGSGGDGGGKTPSVHPTLPYALTNPIWVDLDGDGVTGVEGEPPKWADPAED